MRKLGLLLLSIVLVLSSFPVSILGSEPTPSPAFTYDLPEMDPHHDLHDDILNPDPKEFEHVAVQKKQVLANEHGVAEQELQNLLDAGYTLVEVESALVESKENSISLDRALERVSKAFLNPSATAESEIVDRTDEYVEEIDPEMEAKIAA